MKGDFNLADPDFEPTDEQLEGLAARAFAGVRAANELALQKLRAQIAAERENVLSELSERSAAPRSAT